MRDYVIVNTTDPSEDVIDVNVNDVIDEFIKEVENGTQAKCYNLRVSKGRELFEKEMRGMANE